MSINLGSAMAYMDLDSSRFSAGLNRVSGELRGFTDSSNDTGTRLTSLGNVMKDVGGSMTKALTLPIAAAGTAMVKIAMDTESSMTKVNSILQLSKKEFSDYESTLKSGANEIGLAYDSYADAAYDAISAGVEQANVTKFLNDANKLAKGGLTDLTSATNLLTTVQNAYNLSQEDMIHVSDVLITTQNLGKVTVDELASSMGKIIPTANSLGVNVEQLGAGYAIMTAKGIASAEATTYMSAMFNELGKSGTQVDGILKEISGQSFKELTESGKTTGEILGMLDKYAQDSGLSLSDLFGSSEAAKAAVTLLSNGVEGFNEKLDSMKNSTDATNKAFDEMNSTTSERLSQSLQTLKNALSDGGEAIKPLVDGIANVIRTIAEWISKIAETNPFLVQMAVLILGVVAVVGPLLLMIGSVITMLPVLGAAFTFLTGPIGLAVGAVTALIAVGVALAANWDEVKAKALEVWNSIVNSFKQWMETIKKDIETKWNQIKSFFSTVWESIKDLALRTWEGIKQSISNSVNQVKENITNVFNSVKDFITNTWNNIKDRINEAWEGIKSIVQRGVDLVKTTITNVWNTLYDILTAPFRRAKEFIDNIFSSISNAVSGVIDKVSGIFGRGIDVDINDPNPRDIPSSSFRAKEEALAMARSISNSNNVTRGSIVESVESFSKNMNTQSNIPKQKELKLGNNVTINNTYNSPKPASISDLKKQDEIQMRRLGLQFNL